ncbi:methyltransferase [Lithospermum erythrorhizon]|uniref:Methyltransferase n=1 Tax=Lithospermum erythrorhizon TaxID=34254 RepID=A0AAV3PLE5_LITER
MGGVDDEYLPRKPRCPHNQTKYKLKILVLIICTNLLTFYFFSDPSNSLLSISKHTQNVSLSGSDYNSLVDEFNATRRELSASRAQAIELEQKLRSNNKLVETLLLELSKLNQAINQTSENTKSSYDDIHDDLSNEARLSISRQKLPLGFAPRFGSDELYPPVGGACFKYKDELEKYMSYNVGEECPMDDGFAQKFMLQGCEPLPRRRCHPKSPVGYVGPNPLPDSLWMTPPDTSIIWDPYPCKNYTCLVERKKQKAFYDCKDCFDLQGREKSRWLYDNGALDWGIDNVLSVKPQGTIRIGLDIGGGSGTFAARMKEKNITIITTSMNFDAPFNSFIASRGLIPMHMSVFHRLPFFENTLDIVHSMHVLSNWMPEFMLEFTLYDIYRVLRPGGLFWLDRFFCLGSQLNSTYVPMIDNVGFKKLRWYTGMKTDKGIDRNEWYFSALLEKPTT